MKNATATFPARGVFVKIHEHDGSLTSSCDALFYDFQLRGWVIRRQTFALSDDQVARLKIF